VVTQECNYSQQDLEAHLRYVATFNGISPRLISLGEEIFEKMK